MTALLFAVALALPTADDPPAFPSGMDLLYSDRVALDGAGAPIVPVGLMTGQSQVELRGNTPLRVDFYQQGVLKQATVPAGEWITLTVRRSQPAERRLYIDLERIPWSESSKLDWALAGWRARGYPQVEALAEGTVLGVGGHVLDNREARVVIPVASHKEAQKLLAELYELFGQRAAVMTKLVERPWGELRVNTRHGPLGIATSYVRFTSDGAAEPDQQTITVRDVEYGKGYAWHGREDRTYRGELYAVIDPDGKLAAVNVVGAETLLAGVVPSELFPTAPAEALKAQAVAARNHLLAMLGRRHHEDPFLLCSHQHCQVYTGINREDPRTSHAVYATAGQAMLRDGHLVHAVYSSTCGGHTEDNDAVWGDDPDPALRGRPDFDLESHPELAAFANGIPDEAVGAWVNATPATYCSQAPQAKADKFRWRRTFDADRLNQLVAARFPEVGRLRAVEVVERGFGGKVVGLRLQGERDEALLLQELPIRRLFANLNSGTFVLEPLHDKRGFLRRLTFVGAGWGHGVGMCQLGAIGRAMAGHSFFQILGHYYNGAKVQRLYGSLELPSNARRPTAVGLAE